MRSPWIPLWCSLSRRLVSVEELTRTTRSTISTPRAWSPQRSPPAFWKTSPNTGLRQPSQSAETGTSWLICTEDRTHVSGSTSINQQRCHKILTHRSHHQRPSRRHILPIPRPQETPFPLPVQRLSDAGILPVRRLCVSRRLGRDLHRRPGCGGLGHVHQLCGPAHESD